MSSYLVGYNINSASTDYVLLAAEIKKLGSWWHHLDGIWIVKSGLIATQIINELSPFMEDEDELLVVRLSGSGAWIGFNETGSDWLEENL